MPGSILRTDNILIISKEDGDLLSGGKHSAWGDSYFRSKRIDKYGHFRY
jgi:hypothetical protein